MGKALTVLATQRGYYAGQIREPNDRFEIASEKDFSENWMLPVDENAVDADDPPIEPAKKEPAPKAEVDYSKMKAFQGVKETYGPEGIEISLTAAKERALQEFGHSVDKWNSELNAEDKKKRILAAVSELVKAEQAVKAAE